MPPERHVESSIHPELAEHTQLFTKRIDRIGERVYNAVGYNIANVIMIEGDDGVVIVDTGICLEQGRDTWADLQKITHKPIAGIVYTHHHADHCQGTRAFLTAEQAESGSVPIVAHETLAPEYQHESGLIGPIMSARAFSMYNLLLDGEDLRDMNVGIGPRFQPGVNAFVPPNVTFGDSMELEIAGVRMEMHWVPSEAHSELCIWLPDERTLLSAEVIQDHCYPNIYTVRGAKYRDPQQWYRSIDTMRELAIDADAMVLQHGPHVVGRDAVHEVLRNYRDAIQYTHDQTLRWANRGYAKDEIAAMVRLPPHLETFAPWLRPFYGSVEHSVPQIYCGAIGWFDGDPTALHPTPRAEYATRLVTLMGGRDAVLAEAERAFDDGDPQFVAELTSYVIRIDPGDGEARRLKAAAFRSMGYASINPTWRGFYLTGARVLEGSLDVDAIYPFAGVSMVSAEVLGGFPARNQVDGLPPRLKAEETVDLVAAVAFHYTDVDETWTVEIRRGVAEVRKGAAITGVSGTRVSLGRLLSGITPVAEGIADPALSVDGSPDALVGWLGHFEQLYREFPNYFLR